MNLRIANYNNHYISKPMNNTRYHLMLLRKSIDECMIEFGCGGIKFIIPALLIVVELHL